MNARKFWFVFVLIVGLCLAACQGEVTVPAPSVPATATSAPARVEVAEQATPPQDAEVKTEVVQEPTAVTQPQPHPEAEVSGSTDPKLQAIIDSIPVTFPFIWGDGFWEQHSLLNELSRKDIYYPSEPLTKYDVGDGGVTCISGPTLALTMGKIKEQGNVFRLNGPFGGEVQGRVNHLYIVCSFDSAEDSSTFQVGLDYFFPPATMVHAGKPTKLQIAGLIHQFVNFAEPTAEVPKVTVFVVDPSSGWVIENTVIFAGDGVYNWQPSRAGQLPFFGHSYWMPGETVFDVLK